MCEYISCIWLSVSEVYRLSRNQVCIPRMLNPQFILIKASCHGYLIYDYTKCSDRFGMYEKSFSTDELSHAQLEHDPPLRPFLLSRATPPSRAAPHCPSLFPLSEERFSLMKGIRKETRTFWVFPTILSRRPARPSGRSDRPPTATPPT